MIVGLFYIFIFMDKNYAAWYPIWNLRIQKWAALAWCKITEIRRDDTIEEERYLWNVIIDDEWRSFDLCTLLYSQDSNFFEALFSTDSDFSLKVSKPILPDWYNQKEVDKYHAKKDANKQYIWREHRARCVSAKNPLDYITTALSSQRQWNSQGS